MSARNRWILRGLALGAPSVLVVAFGPGLFPHLRLAIHLVAMASSFAGFVCMVRAIRA